MFCLVELLSELGTIFLIMIFKMIIYITQQTNTLYTAAYWAIWCICQHSVLYGVMLCAHLWDALLEGNNWEECLCGRIIVGSMFLIMIFENDY